MVVGLCSFLLLVVGVRGLPPLFSTLYTVYGGLGGGKQLDALQQLVPVIGPSGRQNRALPILPQLSLLFRDVLLGCGAPCC